jgi:hypothetical protein
MFNTALVAGFRGWMPGNCHYGTIALRSLGRPIVLRGIRRLPGCSPLAAEQ